MSTLTRKQREIAEREELILKTARQLLLEEGYAGLSMDRIAAEIEYSKGTIYQHFRSKEDVLAALAVEASEARNRLFERASLFRARPRERMAAIGEAVRLFAALYPDHFQVEHLIDAAAQRKKTLAQRSEQVSRSSEVCMNIVVGVIRDAIASEDLVAQSAEMPGQLCFGLWSMSQGAHLILGADKPLEDKGIGDLDEALRRNYHAVLDGWGWLPLFADWDWDATYARINSEVFPDEYRQLSRA